MGNNKIAVSILGLAAALLLCGSGPAAVADKAGAPPDYLHWPVPAGAAKYGAIDGHHIWQYVVEQAQIAEHYRDNGHPQFWGRIAGTSGDAEDAQWLLNKYRAGWTDGHAYPDSELPGAPMGAPVLERRGDGRRQDGRARLGAALLRQPRNRRQGSRSGDRLCGSWQRGGFRGA